MFEHEFVADYVPIGKVDHPWGDALPIDLLAEETMLFSCDWNFAQTNGGPITQAVLQTFEDHIPFMRKYKTPVKSYGEVLQCVIDTRVHMLMKGMYPAIPGWHCDGVPRSAKYAQPDLTKTNYEVVFWSCTLSSNPEGCSNTEFVSDDLVINVDPDRVWGSVDSEVKKKNPEIWAAPDGEIIDFSQQQLHRAGPCHTPGWRFFFRLGIVPTPPKNKIRKQVQVYTVEELGW